MENTVKIFMNNNVDMSKGKYAAQAVHAALNAAGVEHDSVVVLGGPKRLVEGLRTKIYDAGRTELTPGTLTCGTDWVPDQHATENFPVLSEDQILAVKNSLTIMAEQERKLSQTIGTDHYLTEQARETMNSLRSIIE